MFFFLSILEEGEEYYIEREKLMFDESKVILLIGLERVEFLIVIEDVLLFIDMVIL